MSTASSRWYRRPLVTCDKYTLPARARHLLLLTIVWRVRRGPHTNYYRDFRVPPADQRARQVPTEYRRAAVKCDSTWNGTPPPPECLPSDPILNTNGRSGNRTSTSPRCPACFNCHANATMGGHEDSRFKSELALPTHKYKIAPRKAIKIARLLLLSRSRWHFPAAQFLPGQTPGKGEIGGC